ncbi:MAG: ATP-binding cassette domain-containing protein [Caldilineales bacterium]|nr:ATP-binding cassette domain-containing protein [Caldilineales bacterium]
MTRTVIRVEDLGKMYRIAAPRPRPGPRPGDEPKILWALHDLSFEVKEGEVLGVVGRNGAGKTTLLKILSRITKPTRGRVGVRGRVGSLLEVGTGFHPELTGRENVFMNGAILGMQKAEIERKFDEIVAFAEVERFLDTPVKRYSTGMTVRLAFAVAAHLEPEILLVDEVLAVGDARFQRKCLNKMEDVGHLGRTVLFVSHNMPAVTRLCPRSILIDGGLLMDAPSPEVVNAYLNSGMDTAAAREWPNLAQAPGGDIVRLRAVRVRGQDGRVAETVDIRQPVSIEMEFDVLRPGYALLPHYHFYHEEGVLAFESIDSDPEWRRRPRPPGRYRSLVHLPGNFMGEGMMYVEAALVTLEPVISQFWERNVVTFQVVDPVEGDSARGDWVGRMDAAVRPMLAWNTDFQPYDADTVATLTASIPHP